jgi:hypothetical protein
LKDKVAIVTGAGSRIGHHQKLSGTILFADGGWTGRQHTASKKDSTAPTVALNRVSEPLPNAA